MNYENLYGWFPQETVPFYALRDKEETLMVMKFLMMRISILSTVSAITEPNLCQEIRSSFIAVFTTDWITNFMICSILFVECSLRWIRK